MVPRFSHELSAARWKRNERSRSERIDDARAGPTSRSDYIDAPARRSRRRRSKGPKSLIQSSEWRQDLVFVTRPRMTEVAPCVGQA